MNNKTKEEIEALLRSLQAGNKIPRYLCYWADGSVTESESGSPVLMDASRREVEAVNEVLVGYLTPHGQFTIAWDPEGSYVVEFSFQFAHVGANWVKGLHPALEEMLKGQWNKVDDSWSYLRRSPSYPESTKGQP